MFSQGGGAARRATKQPRDGSVVQKDWGMYDEIIELLLAAGYFRVRIAGLSEFDKVIGGLCWCITNSLEALDVDIFFQENPSIGQKIRISESVTGALQKMECKYTLEPHQIQGEDFRGIYPVIQWLVKKVMAVRQASTARLFSEALFHKSHLHPLDVEHADRQEQAALPFVRRLESTFAKPVRRFRRTEKIDFASEEAHVQYVLLEYGDLSVAGGAAGEGQQQELAGGRAGLTSLKDGLTSLSLKGEEEQDEQDEEDEEEENLIDDEMRAKLAGAKTSGKVSGREVGGLVQQGSDAIRQAASDYATSQEDAEQLQARLAGGLTEAFQRQLSSLQGQCETAELRHQKLESVNEELQRELSELLAELKQHGEDNERMTAELEEMEKQKTPENMVDLDRLRALVVLNEALKMQEQKFKESCKVYGVRAPVQAGGQAQRDSLVAKIQSDMGGDEVDREEQQRLQQIEEVYAKDLAKFTRVPTQPADGLSGGQVRQMLAKKNQEVAFVQRRIEEVPTRTELTQYQRRFVELYEQVASKLDETRKYFDTFNNLQVWGASRAGLSPLGQDRRTFYGQELDLMNQIYNQYGQIGNDKAKKTNYNKQLEQIKTGIEGSVDKIKLKVGQHVSERDTLHGRYNALQERQRAYFKACREFQEECDKNEYLLSLAEQQ